MHETDLPRTASEISSHEWQVRTKIGFEVRVLWGQPTERLPFLDSNHIVLGIKYNFYHDMLQVLSA